jgi:ArsR family transcriptional regulator, arsenate/arsenite/antimonite-responsive transcriptional repressor
MADIFDVLADGTRRELLSRLERHAGEVSVTELVTELGISQPTVSKHLKVLREHGLVSVREEGQHRYYRLDRAPLGEVRSWLAPFVDGAVHESTERGAGTDADAGSTVFVAWAGSEVGDRVGRAAAETAHSARVALEAAQEKLQGAQKRVTDKLPKWGG